MISDRNKKKILHVLIIIVLLVGILHNLQISFDTMSIKSSEIVNSAPLNSMSNNFIYNSGELVKNIGISALFIGKVSIESLKHSFGGLDEPKNRIMIKELIYEQPGITLRELQRATKLAMGVLQYHVNYLELESIIEAVKLGRSKHFFKSSNEFSYNEKLVFSLIRNTNIKNILDQITNHENQCYQSDLVKQIGISRALMSYYIKLLRENGIINDNQKKLNPTNSYYTILKTLFTS